MLFLLIDCGLDKPWLRRVRYIADRAAFPARANTRYHKRALHWFFAACAVQKSRSRVAAMSGAVRSLIITRSAAIHRWCRQARRDSGLFHLLAGNLSNGSLGLPQQKRRGADIAREGCERPDFQTVPLPTAAGPGQKSLRQTTIVCTRNRTLARQTRADDCWPGD